jgi:integrase
LGLNLNKECALTATTFRTQLWIVNIWFEATKPYFIGLQKIIQQQIDKHDAHVFTYEGSPVTRANNYAWRSALVRTGIKDFRWHDLRHTWASWHVQNGTLLHVLKELGGWADLTMVLRYAHLSSKHLEEYAENSKSVD